MPDARDLPLFRWGEELRRLRLSRRALRIRTGAIVAATLAVPLLLATLLWPPRPLLLWNASASAPVGLYGVGPGTDVRPGSWVVAWPPSRARRLAAERGYLPFDVPLVKPVAAAAGDRLCAIGEAIFVNGRLIGRRGRVDRAGRRLPDWTGCVLLAEDELFLMSPSGASFDGRYFGVTRRSDVIGEAWPLWLP